MSDPTPVKRNVFVRCAKWLASRPHVLWSRIRPAPRTLRAISISTYLAMIALGAYSGTRMHLGSDVRVLLGDKGPPLSGAEQFWLDLGCGAIAASLIGPVAWLLFALLLRLGKWLPTATGRLGLGAVITGIYIAWQILGSGAPAFVFAVLLVVLVGGTAGAVAVWSSGTFAEKGRFGKIVVYGFALLGLGGTGALVFGALHEGTRTHLTKFPVYAADSDPVMVAAADPGRPGPFAGKTGYLTYGSGTDLHRPEFGVDAAIKTETVNGKPFAALPKGHAGRKRELFWGFALHAMPLNGRVWYPKGDGPFPLVLIVHGNHSMREFSDAGYEYLGRHLASHGYILCSVDQNFLNGMRKENDARGWLLLEHLKAWKGFHETAGNEFAGKVDLDRIALVGHSRGGEAVTHAALFNRLKRYPDDATVAFDYGFAIRSLVSIAPVDGQYKPADRYSPVRDVNYLTLHGSHDADVTQFQGDRIYNRVELRKGSRQFKASVYVYRANHGQFNTAWGATDQGPPRSLLLNRAALLDGDEQRRIGKVYITAFLAATLRDDRSYLPLFGNSRSGRDWLPDAAITTRYEDASFQVVADFEEDVDVTTTTLAGGAIRAEGMVVYRESDIALRSRPGRRGAPRDNHGAFLGWQGRDDKGEKPGEAVDPSDTAATPFYEITLPKGFLSELDDLEEKQLVLHLAEVDEKPKAKDYSPKKDALKSNSPTGDEGDQHADDDDEGDDPDEDGDDPDNQEARPMLGVSVQLLTATGVATLPLSRYGRLLPPLRAVTTRAPFLTTPPPKTEITLQVFALPLADFVAASAELDLAGVTGIRLEFDRAQPGVVVVDRVGFADRPE